MIQSDSLQTSSKGSAFLHSPKNGIVDYYFLAIATPAVPLLLSKLRVADAPEGIAEVFGLLKFIGDG